MLGQALLHHSRAAVLAGDPVLLLVPVVGFLLLVAVLRVHGHLVLHHRKEVEAVLAADDALLPLVVRFPELLLLDADDYLLLDESPACLHVGETSQRLFLALLLFLRLLCLLDLCLLDHCV